MSLRSVATRTAFAFAASAPALFAQTPIPIPPITNSELTCSNVAYAFVDPANGIDPVPGAPPADYVAKLNRMDRPFRTIKCAIDGSQYGAMQLYNPMDPFYSKASGLVMCMPGVYGVNGQPPGLTDKLPITMRDRVQVRGQGARRTVLRGGGTDKIAVFWPDAPTIGTPNTQREVLVDFSFEHSTWKNQIQFDPLPWTNNSEEMFDGFTLQGGDVQVFFDAEGEVKGRVSNCVFDMRHDPTSLTGPYFGILMVHVWFNNVGYFDVPANILNNTFVLGEATAASPLLARPRAVAICDVVNPKTPSDQDPNLQLRGYGNPSIQNNLIRLLVQQPFTRATLGIDSTDTEVRVSPAGGSAPGPTNAFHASRVGGTNNVFWSALPPLTTRPVPKVDLDTTFNDPGFVGEACSVSGLGPMTYRDWRVLPGSSMTDAGSNPLSTGTLTAQNGTEYVPPDCLDQQSLHWDMEGYGNPRQVGPAIDIGADEIHGFLMVGNWANDSANHNAQAPHLCLDPNSQIGAPNRHMLFPATMTTNFVGGSARINGIVVTSNCGVTTPFPAWFLPPGSLWPAVVDSTLPADYQTRYIPASNPAPAPTPWLGTVVAQALTDPVSMATFTVGRLTVMDAFNNTPSNYFCTQAVVTTVGGIVHRTNIQPEYR